MSFPYHTISKSQGDPPDDVFSRPGAKNPSLDPGLTALFNQQMALMQNLMNNLSDTTTKMSAMEQEISTLRHEATKLVPDTKLSALEKQVTDLRVVCAPDSKVTNLEQELANLRLSIPTKKAANIPKITDASAIQIPV